MSRNVRSIALALLLVLVSASAAQAMPLVEDPGSRLFSRMLSWIEALISPEVPDLASIFEQGGSIMDPNGLTPGNNLSTPISEEGSQMDPNG